MNIESSPAYQYVQDLVTNLSCHVNGAEHERRAGHHLKVQEYFDYWAQYEKDGQPLLEEVSSIKRMIASRINLTPQEDLIKVGLAGLGRIAHVDANSEFKETKDTIRLINRMRKPLELYERLDPETLVPWTIHGGSIYWPAEIAQDTATSQILLGGPKDAEETLNEALEKASKINLEIGSKKYLGAFSAQGVLWYRKAMISQDLSEMEKAICFVTLAHMKEPNPHRLATIALSTLRSSLSPKFSGNSGVRTACFGYGLSGVMEAFCYDPKDTISSIKQAFRE